MTDNEPTSAMPEPADPKPGSDDARKLGCTCPVMDNAHGKGVFALGTAWWITVGCPVHTKLIRGDQP